jgi:hypothetical protein
LAVYPGRFRNYCDLAVALADASGQLWMVRPIKILDRGHRQILTGIVAVLVVFRLVPHMPAQCVYLPLQ